jgi:GDP-L-fucose synthase
MADQPKRAFWEDRRVVVTGGAGFIGTATVRTLSDLGAAVEVPRSADLDLREMDACMAALDGAEVVIHLAADVGGIGYNLRNPGPLVHDNTLMALNVFEACRRLETEKLVAVCTVCAYPKHAPVPFREESLWDGFPEESNAPYGLAKRLVATLADAYRRQHGLDSCVPVLANVYGPGDNDDLEDSHVIAAMIHKYVAARERGDGEVILWGTGAPTREFLFVDDAARALLLAAERADTSAPFNVGTGLETSIRELAETIARLAGFAGATAWDSSRPDGQPRRYLDVSRARELLGFEAEVDLDAGLRMTIDDFRARAGSPPG